jgi:hypothetical protein
LKVFQSLQAFDGKKMAQQGWDHCFEAGDQNGMQGRVVCPPIRGVAAPATVLNRIVGPLLVTERS